MMRSRALRFAVLSLSLCVGFATGCDGAGDSEPSWSAVSIGESVELTLPDDLVAEPTSGKDSLTAVYRRPSLRVSVDYGWYSDPLTRHTGDGLTRESIVVDGRPATLLTYRADPRDALPHVVALHVPDVGDGRTKLTVLTRGASEADARDGRQIVASAQVRPPDASP